MLKNEELEKTYRDKICQSIECGENLGENVLELAGDLSKQLSRRMPSHPPSLMFL